MSRFALAVAAAAVALSLALPAAASAPPVGPLPKGPVTTVTTARGSLVAVALPHRQAGLVWRLARGSKLLVEVSEANVGKDVVVVFRAAGRGKATIAYGLTRGERTGAKASLTYVVTIRG